VADDEYVQAVSRDGVRLCVRSRGPKDAPAIVFVHGFSQSHLSWSKQFDGNLTAQFRLIAFDLRGHGWSDKPVDAAAYHEPERWGDDVAAVLRACGVERAVLVAWSFGGSVVLDYVATHGSGAIAGIDFVAAVIGNESAYYGKDIRTLRLTCSADPTEGIDGTRAFLRRCFATQPTADDFERMLAYNAMVPATIRKLVLGGNGDTSELNRLTFPVLFTQGTDDGIIAPAMSRYGVAVVPGATLSLYEGVGHAPFYESPERFDRELAAFVRTCTP
jgi:pimeloyl-ACP methyl ester carboxylesterase